MSKKKRAAKPRASVAEAAERARVRKVLDKRDAKGLASLKPGEIALLRRHEQRERDRYMAESLANVPQKTLVQLLDTDRRVVLDWEKAGMRRNPGPASARRVLYNLFHILPWLKTRWLEDGGGAATDSELQDRYERARTRKMELEVAHLEGEVVSLDQVERERIERIHSVKNALLALPRRAAPELMGVETKAEMQDILNRHVEDMLQAFAGGQEIPAAKRRRATKKKAR